MTTEERVALILSELTHFGTWEEADLGRLIAAQIDEAVAADRARRYSAAPTERERVFDGRTPCSRCGEVDYDGNWELDCGCYSCDKHVTGHHCPRKDAAK